MNARFDQSRMERLIALAERLIDALEADIQALKEGKPRNMRTPDPEIQKLSALYAREAAQFDPVSAKAAPKELLARLTTTTRRIREQLALHARFVARVKNMSEGMIHAIADEVSRRKAVTRTYAPANMPVRRPAPAMVFNRVV